MRSISSLRNDIDLIKSKMNSLTQQHLYLDNETNEVKIIDYQNAANSKYYKPSNTYKKVHNDNQNVLNCVMGPFGSGKTTGSLFDLIISACNMPQCNDGIRRSRFLIMRNTTPELETSTYLSWMGWFSALGTLHPRKKPILSVTHRFNDGLGFVEMQVMFIACDKAEQIDKLKSTEFTRAYLNEFVELPSQLLQTVIGRCGRYPSKDICRKEFNSSILADTNPCDTDHWFYNLLEVRKPDKFSLHKQPSGLLKNEKGEWITNPDAENLENLPADYYVKQTVGASEEFIKVYCCGEYGILRHGKPVFNGYNDDLHSCDDIEVDDSASILLGFDFGVVTPAVLICQHIGGQLRAIKEFCGDNSALDELVQQSLLPWLAQNAAGIEYQAVYDPANAGDQLYNVKCSQYLENNKIHAKPAITNSPDLRLSAVKNQLNKISLGKPAFIISRKGCPVLRKGFLGDYHYRKVRVIGEEKYMEKPYKSHPFSDIQDCAQYITMQIQNGGFVKKDNSFAETLLNDARIYGSGLQ